jgi:hypothetical protein
VNRGDRTQQVAEEDEERNPHATATLELFRTPDQTRMPRQPGLQVLFEFHGSLGLKVRW